MVRANDHTPEGILAGMEQRLRFMELRQTNLGSFLPRRLRGDGAPVADPDDAREVGFYWVSSGWDAPNMPFPGNWTIIVSRSGGVVVQHAFARDHFIHFERRFNTAEWEPWYPVSGTVLMIGKVLSASYSNNLTSSLGNTASGADREFDYLIDPADMRATATADRYQFHLPWAGWYSLSMQSQWATNSAGVRVMTFNKNNVPLGGGVNVVDAALSSGGNANSQIDVQTAGGDVDYVNFSLRQTSGAALVLEEAVVKITYLRPGVEYFT
jgi:hypothetical protein